MVVTDDFELYCIMKSLRAHGWTRDLPKSNPLISNKTGFYEEYKFILPGYNLRPTEINAARFFTTINFFTECGVNFPEIYKNIFLYNKFPTFEDKFNPISKKSFWFRSMDKKPKLLDELKISEEVDEKYIY